MQEVRMPGRLEGKVAFITGAARGQGRAHAIAMAKEGADIIAVDICRQIDSNPYPLATPDDLAETERSIKELGRRVVARIADVRERHELRDAVEAGVADLGRIDRYDISQTEGATFGPNPSVEDIATNWDIIRNGSPSNELDGEAMAWGVKAHSTRLQALAAQLQTS
jgi:NAD(P)-dependent dehydrogenase (short-subunit alcohol dehydrogenase family)